MGIWEWGNRKEAMLAALDVDVYVVGQTIPYPESYYVFTFSSNHSSFSIYHFSLFLSFPPVFD